MDEREETTAAAVLAAYERGERAFENIHIDQADFRGQQLPDVSFVDSTLPDALFDHASFSHAEFCSADLKGASCVGTGFDEARIVRTRLRGATMRDASLSAAEVEDTDLTGADLTGCDLSGTHLVGVTLDGATLDRAVLGGTSFSDVDLAPFCGAADLSHEAPSFVDLRSVLRSYRHPDLKRFLVDCGVPPAVAEQTIVAAEAEGEGALQSLMRSTFISYGRPDEAFAQRLYDTLRAHGVTTFYFPVSARIGRRISNEVHVRIQEHDRVILVCSRASLDRPGLRNEIQETFDREARDGGATYLLPIRLDDYVLTEWADPLATRVRDRVVGDFSAASGDDRAFDREVRRLLAELRRT